MPDAMTEAVIQELRRDSRTAELPVDVDVFDRIVFVQGAVPTIQSVADLTTAIERVPDVAEVIDELDVDAELDPVEFMGFDLELAVD